MEILVLLLIFMIVSTGGVLGAIFGEKKYEEMLPVTHFVLIIIMFFAGIFDQLNNGVLFVCILVALSYLICLFYGIKHRQLHKLKQNIFTDCFWVFLVFYIIICICNIGKETHYWDEFTCWATRVKEMCRIDTLYTSEYAHVSVASYPPGTALLQYLYEKIQYFIVGNEKFVSWYLYISYQVFMVSFLMPLLGKVNCKRKHVQFYILGFILFSLPLMFYNNAYDTIMADQLMGVMLGYCFVLLLNSKGQVFELIVFTLCQITLFLMKDVMIFFCVLMWVYWIIDSIIQKRYTNKNNIILSFLGIVSFFLIRFLWSHNLIVNGVVADTSEGLISSYSGKMSVSSFAASVFGFTQDYRQTTFLNYCYAFFTGNRGRKYFDSGCYDIGSFHLGGIELGLSYFVLLICSIILSIYLNKCYQQHFEKQRQKYLTIGEYILVLGYFGIVLLTYMFVFSEGEAVSLNCYDRYISMVFLMMAYILIAEWIRLKWNNNTAPSLCLVLALCLVFPGQSFIQFIDRQNVYDSKAVRDSYIDDINKIQQVIDEDELNIGYFNLEQSENALLKYYKLTYGFSTNRIDNMLWSKEDLVSADARERILDQYDYILIYNNTDEFRQLIGAEVEYLGEEVFDLYRIQDKKFVRIL